MVIGRTVCRTVLMTERRNRNRATGPGTSNFSRKFRVLVACGVCEGANQKVKEGGGGGNVATVQLQFLPPLSWTKKELRDQTENRHCNSSTIVLFNQKMAWLIISGVAYLLGARKSWSSGIAGPGRGPRRIIKKTEASVQIQFSPKFRANVQRLSVALRNAFPGQVTITGIEEVETNEAAEDQFEVSLLPSGEIIHTKTMGSCESQDEIDAILAAVDYRLRLQPKTNQYLNEEMLG